MNKREAEREKNRVEKMLVAFKKVVKILRTISPKKRAQVLVATAEIMGLLNDRPAGAEESR